MSPVAILPRRLADVRLACSVECTVVDENGKPVEEQSAELPKHKKNPEIGNKTTTFAAKMLIEQDDAVSFDANEEVTFMDWGNGFVSKDSSKPIRNVSVKLHLEGRLQKDVQKGHLASADAVCAARECAAEGLRLSYYQEED